VTARGQVDSLSDRPQGNREETGGQDPPGAAQHLQPLWTSYATLLDTALLLAFDWWHGPPRPDRRDDVMESVGDVAVKA
jgi:hypothetical protein